VISCNPPLCQLLIDEPNDHSGMMLNHLMMAEQYELANLKRHSLWQLELIQWVFSALFFRLYLMLGQPMSDASQSRWP
jgi:hypothetical protein